MEGGPKFWGVPQRGEDPEAAGRVGVGQHLVRLVLRAVVAAPHLGVAQEEQLLRGQTQAGHRPRVSRVCVIAEEGREGCLQPSVVCNVFSKSGPEMIKVSTVTSFNLVLKVHLPLTCWPARVMF